MGALRSAFDVDGPIGPHAARAREGPAAAPLIAAPVRAIVFDAADVLYDATLGRRRLLQLVHQMGVPAEYASFYRDWDRHYLADVHCGRREYTEALESYLLACGLTWAQIDEIEAASRILSETLELGVRALSGVVKTIGQLAELGLPLLVWADSPHPAAKATELLDRLGLANCFQAVLSSFDLEATQPSAECYASILARLALPPREVVYVGHDGEHLAGAQAAGLRTVAFNFHDPAAADFYLTRFEDLLGLVQVPAVRPGGRPAKHDARGDWEMLVKGSRR